MQRSEVMKQLQTYFVDQVLDGKNIGLDETTPLLEWGVINSIEIVRLMSFIHKKFTVEIPPDQMLAENFADISAIADMVLTNQDRVVTSASSGIDSLF